MEKFELLNKHLIKIWFDDGSENYILYLILHNYIEISDFFKYK